MTAETNIETVERDKKRIADAISGGIFLISLGVLLYTGWWWPGIMIALGLSSGASLIFRGRMRIVSLQTRISCKENNHAPFINESR